MIESLPEVLEQKYNFSAPTRQELVDWAEYALEPDPEYPEGVINSLYYDTPDLELYQQKRSSEYLKFKVRLRWYGDAPGASSNGQIPGHLEVKRKIGSVRRKQRTAVSLCPCRIGRSDFACEEIAGLSEWALENHYPDHSALIPMAHIRYRRLRYIDPASNARIALDWEIGCGWFNQEFVPLEAPIWLERGVLEVKGRMRHLPRSLEPVAFMLHKNAFSKYAQCLEQLMYPYGVRI
jgi:hypothetical protein